MPRSDQAEVTDSANVIKAQEVFLEDGDIHLVCHKNQRPFLISRIVYFFGDINRSENSRDVFINGSQQGSNLSLHMSMVTDAQVRCSEVVF
jgi:hypothetical protein